MSFGRWDVLVLVLYFLVGWLMQCMPEASQDSGSAELLDWLE